VIREAVFVREVGRLTDEEVALAARVDLSTVRAWRLGTETAEDASSERLLELSTLAERLTRVIDPSYIRTWLREPVPAIGGETPLDAIARGDYGSVARLVSALEDSPVS